MSTDLKIEAALHELGQRETAWMRHRINAWCDSPIEQLFVLELLRHQSIYGAQLGIDPDEQSLLLGVASSYGITSARRFLVDARPPIDRAQVIGIQASIEGMRVDLTFTGAAAFMRVAVELDGHNFHERTEDQARRDKSRDRRLAELGWIVLRFTGSEVYADPGGVLQQIDDVINAGIRRKGAG